MPQFFTILKLLKHFLIPSRQSALKSGLQLCALSLLLSCGYRVADPEDRKTISVPYVEGDQQGELTAELIWQLEHTGLYEFVRGGADLVLKVSIIGDQKETIGFSYDRHAESGKIEKNLMATENRRNLVAKVTLLEGEKVVLGPVEITGWGEYDYVDVNSLRALSFINENGKREKVITFSLGQLDSVEGAEDNVLVPAYRLLARKIVMALERAVVTAASGD
jgi:hypothetical protein